MRDHVDSTLPRSSRRAELVAHSAWVAALLALGLAAARFAVEGRGSVIAWTLIAGATGFSGVPAWIAMRRGPLAAIGLPAIALTTLTTMAYLEQGLSSDALVWFPFVPIVAALFVGGRGAALFGGATLCAVAIVAVSPETWLTGPALMLRLLATSGAVTFGAVLGWLYERTRVRSLHALRTSKQRSDTLLEAIPDVIARVGSGGDILELKRSVVPAGWSPREHASIADWSEDGAALYAQVRDTLRMGIQTQRVHVLRDATGEAACEIRMAAHGDDHVVAIVRDVSERRRLERLKEDFVATVSHELRTPLTAIGGAIRLLKFGSLSEAQTRSALDVGERNVTRLEKLVGDLLDFQRLEARRISLVNEPVDLAELLHELAARFRDTTTHGVSIRVRAESPCEAVLDAHRLRRVVEELISNAVEVAPEGSTVRVRLESTAGDGVRILVEDEGPGVPEHAHDGLFAAFSKIDAPESRERSGLGMGLAPAQRIARAMGGRLGCDRLDSGSRFWIELPAACLPARAHPSWKHMSTPDESARLESSTETN